MTRGENDPLPPLRTRLEAVPAGEDAGADFVLRDLEDLSDKPVGLSHGAMLLLSLLDGRRTAAQVRDLFRKSSGAEVDAPTILALVDGLEKAGYLETAEAADKRRLARDAFRAAPRRAPAFAGLSYAGEAAALSGELAAFFRAEGGPGKDAAPGGARPAPLGLVAPHIDFGRGGPAYAWAYRALAERRPPDAIVALGVAHVSPDSPWTLTPKTYETPLGGLEVDAALYGELASKLWYDPRADEWVHQREHSLEFQAVWLRHAWKERTPPWVPVLVSSFERFSPDEAPSKAPAVEKAIKDLGAVLRAQADAGRRVMVLCGIDLAHVGPRFGDEEEVTPELQARVEAEDRKSLIDAMALDADGFYRSVVADGHWRKVCGLSALYTGLRLMKELGASPGRLLTYGQAPDPAGGLVSFASAVFD